MKKTELKATDFYKSIKKNEQDYKLINDLFIVRFTDKNKSVFVGEFLKSMSARNESKSNKVIIFENDSPQQFYKEKDRIMTTTVLGFWKKLSIGFQESPIKNITR